VGQRQYAQKEWRLLSWWLAQFHPHADISMNVRIGPTTGAAVLSDLVGPDAQMARVRNRWADAVFVESGAPAIVEAKLEPDPGIFSQLIHYARKFRADPQFAQFANMPLALIAVVYHDDPSVSIEAPFYGVRWIVYQPNLSGFPPAAVKANPLSTAESPVPLQPDWPARLKSWGIVALNQ
jgi:hypothetical protein